VTKQSEQAEQAEQREPARQIERVAVVGAGYMGGGIAQVLALAGLHVTIVDAEPSLTRRHLERLWREAEDFEARGLFDPGSAERVRGQLGFKGAFLCEHYGSDGPGSSARPVAPSTGCPSAVGRTTRPGSPRSSTRSTRPGRHPDPASNCRPPDPAHGQTAADA